MLQLSQTSRKTYPTSLAMPEIPSEILIWMQKTIAAQLHIRLHDEEVMNLEKLLKMLQCFFGSQVHSNLLEPRKKSPRKHHVPEMRAMQPNLHSNRPTHKKANGNLSQIFGICPRKGDNLGRNVL